MFPCPCWGTALTAPSACDLTPPIGALRYKPPVRWAACCRKEESKPGGPSTRASTATSARCAEKMAFITGMYCMGTSGDPTRQSNLGRHWDARRGAPARASELGLERSRCTRHSALDRAPLSASGARGELAASCCAMAWMMATNLLPILRVGLLNSGLLGVASPKDRCRISHE